jgi:hypothetical protein
MARCTNSQRRCERSEAIQEATPEELDSFVASLAMTDFGYSAQQNIPTIPIPPSLCLSFCLLRFRAARGMLSPTNKKYSGVQTNACLAIQFRNKPHRNGRQF